MNVRALKSVFLLGLREWDVVLRIATWHVSKRRRKIVNKARWEAEYASGRWSYLESLQEAAHYYVLASYLAKLKPNATVLDVGCGHGVLQPVLSTIGYATYTGIDISENAIRAAKHLENETTNFIACNAQEYNTYERYDAIFFSEYLYYFEEPQPILAKYGSLLNEGGIFLISMAMVGVRDGLYSLSAWQKIEKENTVIHEVCLYTRAGVIWIVKALTPRIITDQQQSGANSSA